jgi:hypothetical protein
MFALGAILVLLHVTFLFWIIPMLTTHLGPSDNHEHFPDGYDGLANSLVNGSGYRFYPDTALTLMREPGFPLFLAGLFVCCGRSIIVVKLANMIMAFVTAFIVVLISKRTLVPPFSQNRRFIVVPSVLFLLYPGTLIAESRGGVEIMFALMLTLYVLTIQVCISSNRLISYATSGFVLGLTVLIRSTPLLFPIILLAFLVQSRSVGIAKAGTLKGICIMMTVMAVVLSPWIIRNYRLTGAFVPTASVFGISAQAGQYIGAHLFEGRPMWLLDREASRVRDGIAEQLGYSFKDDGWGYYQAFYKTDDELRFSSHLSQLVLREYRSNPWLFARCTVENLVGFWVAGKTWRATAANAVVQLPLLALAITGSIHCWKIRKFRTVVPMVLIVVYVVAVHAPILAQARYSIPLIPIVSVLATIGGYSLLSQWRKSDLKNVSMAQAS